jgi:hypothetical protein
MLIHRWTLGRTGSSELPSLPGSRPLVFFCTSAQSAVSIDTVHDPPGQRVRILIVLGVALLVAVLALQPRVWALPSAPQASEEPDSATRKIPPEVRRRIAFGYSKVLADWGWLRAIQYYGSKLNQQYRYRGLYALLDETTDLDPGFEYAYQFGGQSIPFHDSGTKVWYNIGATVDLLKKGIAAAPKRWQIPWLLGFTLYTYRGDYANAGRAIEQASKLPGAPAYMASLATRLLAEGSDIDTAIFLTQSALVDARDERVKGEITARLQSLVLQRDLDVLNAAAAERRKTSPVNSLSDLVGSAGVTSIPEDPFGGNYQLDHTSGRVTSLHQDKLVHLFIHPGSPALEQAAD